MTMPDTDLPVNPYPLISDMRKQIINLLMLEGQKKQMPIESDIAEQYLTAMEDSFLQTILDDPRLDEILRTEYPEGYSFQQKNEVARESLYQDLLLFYNDLPYTNFIFQEAVDTLYAADWNDLSSSEQQFLITAEDSRSAAKSQFMQYERIGTDINSVNAYQSLNARFTKTKGVKRDDVADYLNNLTDLSSIDDEAYNNLLDTLVKEFQPKLIRSNDVRRQQGLADQTFSEYAVEQSQTHIQLVDPSFQFIDPSLMEGFDPMSKPMRNALQIKTRLPAWMQPHVNEAMGIGPEVLTAIDEAELKAEADPWATMYIALQSMGKLEGLTEQDRRLLIERTQREAESRHSATNALLQAQGQRPISFEESVMQDIETGRITGEIPPPTRIGPDGEIIDVATGERLYTGPLVDPMTGQEVSVAPEDYAETAAEFARQRQHLRLLAEERKELESVPEFDRIYRALSDTSILAGKTEAEKKLWINRNLIDIRNQLSKIQNEEVLSGTPAELTTNLEQYLESQLPELDPTIPGAVGTGPQGELIDFATKKPLPIAWSQRPDETEIRRKEIFTPASIDAAVASQTPGEGNLSAFLRKRMGSKAFQDEFLKAQREGETPWGTTKMISPGSLSVLASQTFTPDPNAILQAGREKEQATLRKLDADQEREIEALKAKYTFLDVVDAEGNPQEFVERLGLNLEDYFDSETGTYRPYADPSYDAGVEEIRKKYELGKQHVMGGTELNPEMVKQHQSFLSKLPTDYRPRVAQATKAAKTSPLAQLGAGPVPGVAGGGQRGIGIPAPKQTSPASGASWSSLLRGLKASYPEMSLSDYVNQKMPALQTEFKMSPYGREPAPDPRSKLRKPKTFKAPTGPRLFGRV